MIENNQDRMYIRQHIDGVLHISLKLRVSQIYLFPQVKSRRLGFFALKYSMSYQLNDLISRDVFASLVTILTAFGGKAAPTSIWSRITAKKWKPVHAVT